MQIRSAEPEDVPAVLPMVRKIAAFHENLDPAKYGFRGDAGDLYEHWLIGRSTDPNSVFLVADAGDRLAGFLIGTVEREIPIYRVEEFGFIHDLWIEEPYRNEGLARQMTTLALERFGALGVPQVRLDVVRDNPAARALFERCGFRPSITEMLIEL